MYLQLYLILNITSIKLFISLHKSIYILTSYNNEICTLIQLEMNEKHSFLYYSISGFTLSITDGEKNFLKSKIYH